MALYYILNLPVSIFQELVCVDSKSMLNALESLNMRLVTQIVIEKRLGQFMTGYALKKISLLLLLLLNMF